MGEERSTSRCARLLLCYVLLLPIAAGTLLLARTFVGSADYGGLREQTVAEQRVAGQRGTEQRGAEQRVAGQRGAEQRGAEQRVGGQRGAEQSGAEHSRPRKLDNSKSARPSLRPSMCTRAVLVRTYLSLCSSSRAHDWSVVTPRLTEYPAFLKPRSTKASAAALTLSSLQKSKMGCSASGPSATHELQPSAGRRVPGAPLS